MMIRSSPAFCHLACPSNLSKLTMDEGRSSPFPYSQGEDHSNYSGQDDDSTSSAIEDYHEQRSPGEVEDLPLNLSCKRKRTENYPMSSPYTNIDSKMQPLTEDYNPVVSAQNQQMFPNEAIEKVIMQYRAQLLATNDLVRVLMQRRWHEELSTAFGRPVVGVGECTNQWLPVSTSIPAFGVPLNSASLPNSTYSYQDHDYKVVSEEEWYGRNAHNSKKCFSSSSSAATSPVSSPPMSPSNDHLKSQRSVCSPKNLVVLEASDLTPSPPPEHPGTYASPKKSVPFVHKKNCLLKASSDNETASSPKNSSLPENNRKRKCAKRNEGLTTNNNTDFYSCSICGASYPHKFELNRHVKVSHVRPHRCTQCGKGFGHRNYLKVHIETVHMGQKTHQCRLCGKYLSTGGNLNVHVRTIHLGEKKYNCPVCSRSFGQQCNMKTHMKRHYSKSDEN